MGMRIEGCVLEILDDQAKLSSKIICADKPRELWFSIPKEHAGWFTVDRSDGFVVALLLQAMARNEDIVTDAPMSSRLWHSLSHFYIPMMVQAFPELQPIRIIPSALTSKATPGTGVATGFSAGIDSFAAVIKHFVREESADHRVTDFLFHNVGSHGPGEPETCRRLFRKRFEVGKPFTEEAGIPFVPVDSNLGDIFPIDFVKTHAALNAGVLLVLQNRFRQYLYAAAYKYVDCKVVRGVSDIAYMDPMAVHLLSTEGLECVSTGCEMSRVEKTALVGSYEPSRRYLNVCVDPDGEGKNCSVCFKCRRTMLTLELLGLDHLYDKVFDFGKFARVRRRYMKEIILHYPNSFEAEIAESFFVPRSRAWKWLIRTGGWIRKHRQYKAK